MKLKELEAIGLIKELANYDGNPNHWLEDHGGKELHIIGTGNIMRSLAKCWLVKPYYGRPDSTDSDLMRSFFDVMLQCAYEIEDKFA